MENLIPQPDKTNERPAGDWASDIAPGIISKNEKTTRALLTLTDQVKESKELLMNALANIGALYDEFERISNKMLTSARSFRMGAVVEVASAMKPFQDLRKFFLEKDHETEITRLREFVDLCERLKVLKDSGFLDTVADTMLKLG